MRVDVAAEDAKRTLGELLSRVGFGNERIPITRHGKRIAALVSAADLDLLDEVTTGQQRAANEEVAAAQ